MKSWIVAIGCCLCLWLPVAASAGSDSEELKVISYNIWNGFEGDNARRERFVEWIKGQTADIIVLTELVGFKEKDLVTLGAVCGLPHTALSKEEGYPVGVLSATPVEVVTKRTDGFWHGMLHVRTAGIDVIATHLSPFEWSFRLREAAALVAYISENGLTDYLVAGDLNAHSPLDADELATHDGLLAGMQGWDASQATYRNLRDGRYDFSVMACFLASGLEDAVGRLVRPASARMSYPSAFAFDWQIDQKQLLLRRERLDYILLSPSLMGRCAQAGVYPVEGVSDHYPVSVTLQRNKSVNLKKDSVKL